MNNQQRDLLGFRIIGAGKFGSGLLMLVAGFGLFRSIGVDLGIPLQHFAERIHLDPDNHAIHAVIAKVSGLTPKQLKLLGIGTFLYAAIHLFEGTGLLLAKRWAEYFTILSTGLLLPVEFYEILEKATALRIAILSVNLGVVAYLVYRLTAKKAAEPGGSGSLS